MMAHLVGCRLSDRFAAIAVVSGELTVDCKPEHPVSVPIIHGTAEWPGGERMSAMLDEPSTALDATRVIWAFFATHPKQ